MEDVITSINASKDEIMLLNGNSEETGIYTILKIKEEDGVIFPEVRFHSTNGAQMPYGICRWLHEKNDKLVFVYNNLGDHVAFEHVIKTNTGGARAFRKNQRSVSIKYAVKL